jgi:hypothetical protein
MTAVAHRASDAPLGRRARAANTVDAALRGGFLWAAVALVAWFVAVAIAGTAFFLVLLATAAAAAWALLRGNVNLWVWGSLAAAWAIIMLERWTVNDHGGVWVAAASWLGVVAGARSAGIARRLLPLLAYPVVGVVLLALQGESILDPWGISWLWLAAILGPVAGIRTLLRPSQAATKTS